MKEGNGLTKTLHAERKHLNPRKWNMLWAEEERKEVLCTVVSTSWRTSKNQNHRIIYVRGTLKVSGPTSRSKQSQL